MANEATSDVKEEVGQVTTEAESSTAGTEEPAVQEELTPEAKADKEILEDLQESEDTTKEEDGEAEADANEEPEVEEADKEVEPKKDAESRKEALNLEIRDLVSKRNELRAEITDINAKVYTPQSAQELIDQGVDPALARVEALEQRTQMAEFNAHVTDLNANLNIESLQVMNDFPVFNPDAPEYDEALSQRAREVYEQAAQIQTDPKTGLIIQSNANPYNIYKAFAETAGKGVQDGAVKGQIAAEKNLAAADTVSSAAPKQPKEDNFLKGLTGESN